MDADGRVPAASKGPDPATSAVATRTSKIGCDKNRVAGGAVARSAIGRLEGRRYYEITSVSRRLASRADRAADNSGRSPAVGGETASTLPDVSVQGVNAADRAALNVRISIVHGVVECR